jgi:hypothetical protein
MTDKEKTTERKTMHRREITLADGRYMIFYTFGTEETEEKENEQGEDV